MVYDVVKKDINEEQMKQGVVLLNFHATWCGPCKMLSPVLDEASEKMGVTVFKVDVDHDREFAKEMEVHGTPTTFIYKNGEAVDKVLGYMPAAQMIEVLKRYK